MNLKELKSQLLLLQSSICSNLVIDDAIIENIEIVFDDKPKGAYYPPHTHTWYEFNYITTGSMTTILGDNCFTVKKGEFFLIPPQTEHAHRYNPKSLHEGICLRWRLKKATKSMNPGKAHDLLNNLREWKFNAISDNYSIGYLFSKMFDEVGKGYFPISLQLNFMKIITTLAEINKTSHYITKPEADFVQQGIIKKIEIYLKDNIRSNIDVHDIAASLHMSYGYLARVYKKYTGETIIDRLCTIKLEKAQKLMEKPEIALKEIADLSGFSNQYYFSNVFKNRFGLSPKEYRKKL